MVWECRSLFHVDELLFECRFWCVAQKVLVFELMMVMIVPARHYVGPTGALVREGLK